MTTLTHSNILFTHTHTHNIHIRKVVHLSHIHSIYSLLCFRMKDFSLSGLSLPTHFARFQPPPLSILSNYLSASLYAYLPLSHYCSWDYGTVGKAAALNSVCKLSTSASLQLCAWLCVFVASILVRSCSVFKPKVRVKVSHVVD